LKTRSDILSALQRVLPGIRARYPVGRVELFGSFARNDQGEGSDVDLAVEFTGPLTCRTLMSLEDELAEALGVSVDIADLEGLKPRVRERMAREAVEV
jgi:predicted nucleotidyltransferase